MPSPALPAATALLSAAALASPAAAAVVYQNDFNGPSPLADFSISNATDATITASGTVGGGALQVSDTSTAGGTFATGVFGFDAASAFDTSQTGQEVIKFSFDVRIDSFTQTGVSSAANPRIVIRESNGNFLTIGFGRRGGYAGYAPLMQSQTRNLFYVASSNGSPTPTDTDTNPAAIGFPAGSPTGVFAPGFDFGPYSTSSSEANDSSVSTAGVDGNFFRFELTYVDQADTISGTVINLDTNDVTTFTQDVATPASFSNTASDRFDVTSGSSSSSLFFVDNLEIEVSAIPEPGSLALLALGGCLTLGRRRRRSREVK